MPKNNSRIRYDDSLIRLRFIGEAFEGRSVPIYELGVALIAVQRIINKTYLYQTGELLRTSWVEAEARDRIALQLGSRHHSSDGYGFTAFLSDPNILPILQQVVANA